MPQPHAAPLPSALPVEDGDRGAQAVEPQRAVDRATGRPATWPKSSELISDMRWLRPLAAWLMRDLAFGDGQLLDRDLAGVEGRRRPHRPVDRAVGGDVDRRLRPHQPHVEDQQLAAHEGRQFRIHRECLDGHRRLAVRAAADRDVGEGHRRKRQQPRRRLALDGDLAAEDGARLALEIGAVARPVDKIRRHQRRGQRQHEKATKDHEQPCQHQSPAYGLIESAALYPHQRVDKVAICNVSRRATAVRSVAAHRPDLARIEDVRAGRAPP